MRVNSSTLSCWAADFELDLEGKLLELQAQLLDHPYQPGGYHSFYLHEPKHRLLSAAPSMSYKLRKL